MVPPKPGVGGEGKWDPERLPYSLDKGHHRTTAWSIGLSFMQWGINTIYHMGIMMTLYEAVFSQKARDGLTTNIPAEFLESVTNGIYKGD